ncbi:MAG: ABC transporter ATP-binding protein/permease [Pseudomonadota bacterium]
MDANLFRYIWQHSRREQIFVLVLIALSLPFYWMSLDVPKRIVNEALQGRAFEDGNITATLFAFSIPLPEFLGGGSITLSEGWLFDQLGYLIALSLLFLFFVLCNGAFKFVINVQKGILAERMLRRMRFDLFARLMRFRPERIRAVKPAEAASMINNEVEPIGGFIGDAFIQPAFLGTQALTALLFIMVQSVWLGLVALSIVLIQAFVIPILRREQLRLGRLRQIASRKLAGRIGEMVDQSRLIYVHGLQAYSKSEIGQRLGHLFNIRAALFKRKFAVKYLNNFLAQITPFFFYSIGGYLALTGNLDIGQLVAVIAAYRDLPPPIKELIDWDQRRADVTIKYEQVISQFASEPQANEFEPVEVTPGPHVPIALDGVRVSDQRGTPLLENFAAEIQRPTHVALVGPASSGRDLVARIIARQISDFEGRARIGETDIRALSELSSACLIGYVPPDPILFAGSIRDNITIALRHNAPPPGDTANGTWREAERSGNPLLDYDADWHDYKGSGTGSPEQLERRVIDCLAVTGMTEDLYNFGLQGRVGDIVTDGVKDRLIKARRQIRSRLDDNEISDLVVPFDVDQFNPQATVAENLVFGVVASERLAGTGLASDPYFRTIIAAEALEYPLIEIGLQIAESAVEVFSDLPSGHPLFDRFSMIASDELDTYADLIAQARSKATTQLSTEGRDTLMALAFAYIEPRHRLGLVTPALKARIIRARSSFRRFLPQEYEGEIEFYTADELMLAAPVRDNVLFGHIAYNIANADKKVAEILDQVMDELDLRQVIFALGLDYDVGPGGRALFAQQRTAIGLARNLIQRPSILVLEDAFKPFSPQQRESVIERIRSQMHDRTLIATLDDESDAESFDDIYTFQGPRGRRADSKSGRRSTPSPAVQSAPALEKEVEQ